MQKLAIYLKAEVSRARKQKKTKNHRKICNAKCRKNCTRTKTLKQYNKAKGRTGRNICIKMYLYSTQT